MKNKINNSSLSVQSLLSILCFILAFLPAHLIAQENNIREIRGIKSEKKANNSSYIVIEQGDMNLVYNKNNVLFSQYSRYEETSYLSRGPIKFDDRPFIDSLITTFIAPYICNYSTGLYDDGVTVFSLTLFSKPDGKVCELLCSYPKDYGIPIETIDCLEKAILKAGLRLIFNPNDAYFRGAVWVNFDFNYSTLSMKRMLKESKR